MQRTAIERLLPGAYQRAATEGSLLAALLDAMTVLHAPAEELLDGADRLFAPYLTPDQLVPYLLGWVALDHLPPLPVDRQRDLLTEGATLARVRGTPDGLLRVLEIATGLTGFVLEEPPDRPFHVLVHVPAAGAEVVGLVSRIVELEKPAAVTVQIVLDTAPEPA